MAPSFNIAIVDDHDLFLQGMIRLLEEFPHPVLAKAYHTGLALLADLDKGQTYDLIVADLAMRPINGITLISALAERNLGLPVIIVSGAEDAITKSNAQRLGAFDFVHKSASKDHLFGTIQAALDAGPEARNTLRKTTERTQLDTHEGELVLVPKLAPQQVRVLRLLAEGLTNKEIGKSLSISENTVKTHLKSIFRELSVTSRASAVRRGSDLGLF